MINKYEYNKFSYIESQFQRAVRLAQSVTKIKGNLTNRTIVITGS